MPAEVRNEPIMSHDKAIDSTSLHGRVYVSHGKIDRHRPQGFDQRDERWKYTNLLARKIPGLLNRLIGVKVERFIVVAVAQPDESNILMELAHHLIIIRLIPFLVGFVGKHRGLGFPE